jgi:hypothetical protein
MVCNHEPLVGRLVLINLVYVVWTCLHMSLNAYLLDLR